MLKPKKVSKREARAYISTHNTALIAKPTGNIYESIAVISKRARQISVGLKDELSQKISEFATSIDNLEEVHENREQIEISKYYERMPKPTILSLEEFLDGKLVFFHQNEQASAEK